MKTIDLNCDLGEGFGAWEMGNDAAMIELASSVNVACGFHAGDPDIMRRTVELAKARGVSVGAHPGYRDLHGFGRHPIAGLKASEIENLVAYQIGALQAIATAAGHKVTHVKAHGALSNVACEDDMTAKAIAAGIKGGRSRPDFRRARQFEVGEGRRRRQSADGARGVRRPRL
ncbi:lactam utilization protein B [Bradyrhizobium sp. LB13.1]